MLGSSPPRLRTQPLSSPLGTASETPVVEGQRGQHSARSVAPAPPPPAVEEERAKAAEEKAAQDAAEDNMRIHFAMEREEDERELLRLDMERKAAEYKAISEADKLSLEEPTRKDVEEVEGFQKEADRLEEAASLRSESSERGCSQARRPG